MRSRLACLLNALLAGMMGTIGAAHAQYAARPATAAPGGSYQIGDKLAPGTASATSAGAYKLTDWDALTPRHWNPMKGFDMLSFSRLRDGDPRAMQALDKLKQAWDHAPTEPSMNNARIRIAGFVIPLDAEGEALREFLLAPYFGACIHTPPPPANQVILVTLATPVKGVRMMDAVWVSGQMHIEASDTGLGVAGYRMDGVGVAPYQGRR